MIKIYNYFFFVRWILKKEKSLTLWASTDAILRITINVNNI